MLYEENKVLTQRCLTVTLTHLSPLLGRSGGEQRASTAVRSLTVRDAVGPRVACAADSQVVRATATSGRRRWEESEMFPNNETDCYVTTPVASA